MPDREPEISVNYGIISSGGTSYVGNQAVGPNAIAISRDIAQGSTQQPVEPSRQPRPQRATPKVKVLFLAASPGDTTSLQLDTEIREILEKVRAADLRDHLDIVARWAVQADDLLQHLNEHRPQIVHFSGHGARNGQIVVEDKDRQSAPLSRNAVTHLFSAFADTIRLVVFNACFSLAQAKAITDVIDCATGTPAGIADSAAIAFAAAFYRAIAFGHSISQAFDQGCVALDFQNVPETLLPRLLVRKGVDPSSVALVNP